MPPVAYSAHSLPAYSANFDETQLKITQESTSAKAKTKKNGMKIWVNPKRTMRSVISGRAKNHIPYTEFTLGMDPCQRINQFFFFFFSVNVVIYLIIWLVPESIILKIDYHKKFYDHNSKPSHFFVMLSAIKNVSSWALLDLLQKCSSSYTLKFFFK